MNRLQSWETETAGIHQAQSTNTIIPLQTTQSIHIPEGFLLLPIRTVMETLILIHIYRI